MTDLGFSPFLEHTPLMTFHIPKKINIFVSDFWIKS